jgi:hypothetical protein
LVYSDPSLWSIQLDDRSALDAAMRLVESADERNVDADRPAAAYGRVTQVQPARSASRNRY